MVEREEIAFETVVPVTNLSATEEQSRYVASNAVSIAEIEIALVLPPSSKPPPVFVTG